MEPSFQRGKCNLRSSVIQATANSPSKRPWQTTLEALSARTALASRWRYPFMLVCPRSSRLLEPKQHRSFAVPISDDHHSLYCVFEILQYSDLLGTSRSYPEQPLISRSSGARRRPRKINTTRATFESTHGRLQ